jgi:hypothetical protein
MVWVIWRRRYDPGAVQFLLVIAFEIGTADLQFISILSALTMKNEQI